MVDTEAKEIAELLFPSIDSMVERYEDLYPERSLPSTVRVTRFGPSPTGSLHIGGVFTALVSERLAHQSGGIFYLRIEDTDKKREVEAGSQEIVRLLDKFGLQIDEGVNNIGEYGPYIQSERKDIYISYAKFLVQHGMAYPCFSSQEDLEKMREEQEQQKIRPGYYGSWAKHRDLSLADVEKFLREGRSFVVRLRSPGDIRNHFAFEDEIKGNISVTENDMDVVLLKSDGFPTYHFAHIIDDHLMGTTHVIRGDEWLSSLPTHLQLFSMFGWTPPRYGHLSPILKSENGGKRKLSKRKDPEAAAEFYFKEGYPLDAVMEYLLNIANSNFEDWRKENPGKENSEFKIELKRFNKSGALFDINKLENISRTIISKMTSANVYARVLEWASEYEVGLAERLKNNKEYFLKIFSIERDGENPRKDFSKWSEVEDQVFFFFEDLFEDLVDKTGYKYPTRIGADAVKEILGSYTDRQGEFSSREAWFDDLKSLAEELGFARDIKTYKENPDAWRGSIGDVAMVLRIAMTTREKTPDLYEIMKIMGLKATKDRLNLAKDWMDKMGTGIEPKSQRK